jgi:hypothetical protein
MFVSARLQAVGESAAVITLTRAAKQLRDALSILARVLATGNTPNAQRLSSLRSAQRPRRMSAEPARPATAIISSAIAEVAGRSSFGQTTSLRRKPPFGWITHFRRPTHVAPLAEIATAVIAQVSLALKASRREALADAALQLCVAPCRIKKLRRHTAGVMLTAARIRARIGHGGTGSEHENAQDGDKRHPA